MKFSPATIERFKNPRFQGLNPQSDTVGMGGSYRSGRFAVIGLTCSNKVIATARFRTFNCIPAIAAADWICETITGASAEDALTITIEHINQALDGIPLGRLFCVELVLNALRQAVEEAQRKDLIQ